jgi:hypothetical protein
MPIGGIMEILIGSNIATFIFAWIVSRLVARRHFLEQQLELEIKKQNTALWIDYIKSQGGPNE